MQGPVAIPSLEADKASLNVRAFRVGSLELNEGTRELRVAGCVVDMERRPFDLLQVMLQRAPNVVTKDELISAVWHRAIDESSLTTAIRNIRLRLGADNQGLIKTVHGIGYRIAKMPEVTSVEVTTTAKSFQPGEVIFRRPQWRLQSQLAFGSDVWVACHEKTGERRVFKFAQTARSSPNVLPASVTRPGEAKRSREPSTSFLPRICSDGAIRLDPENQTRR